MDFILWYAHSSDSKEYRPVFITEELGGAGGGQTWVEKTGRHEASHAVR